MDGLVRASLRNHSALGSQGVATIFGIVVSKKRPIVSEASTWMCLICGWMYDEATGDPEHGIAPGTAWADVDMNWVCPECGARKEDFEMVRI
jgi:rubredoxin